MVNARLALPETGELEHIGACHLLDPFTNPGAASSIAGSPYAASLSTGDMDADGFENIAYSFGDLLVVITDTTGIISDVCGYQSLPGQPDSRSSNAATLNVASDPPPMPRKARAVAQHALQPVGIDPTLHEPADGLIEQLLPAPVILLLDGVQVLLWQHGGVERLRADGPGAQR